MLDPSFIVVVLSGTIPEISWHSRSSSASRFLSVIEMLTLITIHYLFTRHGVQAFPLLQINLDETSKHCNDRTIWNIIWSCLVTIFACTWVAIHPNVPSPNDSQAVIAFRRMKIVALALIAPEFMIAWSNRQRVIALKLANHLKSMSTLVDIFMSR